MSFPFDPWNVDHVGVLYGPASVLYGTGAIGGAVNVVPRRPDPNSTHGEGILAGGRFGTVHSAVDLTGPINDTFSYRIDVSGRRSNGFVDRGDSNSLAISGSLRYDATQNLRFTLSNDFGDQDPSKYLGTPVLNAAPVLTLRKKNYNLNDAALNFTDNWTTLETDWTISPNVTFHNSTYYLYHDRIYRDVTVFTYVPTNNTVRRTTYRDINNTWQRQLGDTGYVKFGGRVLGRRNDFLVGFDTNRNYYHRNDNIRGGTSIVDALNFNPGNYLDAYQQQAVPFYRMHVNQGGGFFEDRMTLTEQFSLVVGFRRDQYNVHRFDNFTLLTTDSVHKSTAWNGGAVYDIVPGLAAYAQYAVASEPVNSLASIAVNQQSFRLSNGRQIETGVKQTLWQNRIEWTVAAYRIVKKDLLTPAFLNPSVSEQVGRQSSRGMEASIALRTGPVRIDVNGTMLKARFDDFKATVGPSVVSLAGRVPLNVPQQAANILAFWDVHRNWQVRSVLRYVGKRFSDNTNSAAARIPSYKVWDLGGTWRAMPKLSFDFRFENVTDEVYADSGSTTQWILGQPRSASAAARVSF